jgi:hypothetical protein
MGCIGAKLAAPLDESKTSNPLFQAGDKRGYAVFQLLESCLDPLDRSSRASQPTRSFSKEEIADKYNAAKQASFPDGLDMTVFRARERKIDNALKEKIAGGGAEMSQTGKRLATELGNVGHLNLVPLGSKELEKLSREYKQDAPFEMPPWNKEGIKAFRSEGLDQYVQSALVHEVSLSRHQPVAFAHANICLAVDARLQRCRWRQDHQAGERLGGKEGGIFGQIQAILLRPSMVDEGDVPSLFQGPLRCPAAAPVAPVCERCSFCQCSLC